MLVTATPNVRQAANACAVSPGKEFSWRCGLGTSQVIVLIAVVVILAGGIVMLVVYRRSRKEPDLLTQMRGHIDQPGDGETVARTIHCSGSIQRDARSSEIVFWLAVETDGLIWPKEPLVRPDEAGRWVVDIREEGHPDTFAISLWAAMPWGTHRIQEWLETGRRTNDYPGLATLPDARRITRVNGLRLA